MAVPCRRTADFCRDRWCIAGVHWQEVFSTSFGTDDNIISDPPHMFVELAPKTTCYNASFAVWCHIYLQWIITQTQSAWYLLCSCRSSMGMHSPGSGDQTLSLGPGCHSVSKTSQLSRGQCWNQSFQQSLLSKICGCIFTTWPAFFGVKN